MRLAMLTKQLILALLGEQLNRPTSLPIPSLRTLTDELALFALHDAYLVDKLAYVREGPRVSTIG